MLNSSSDGARSLASALDESTGGYPETRFVSSLVRRSAVARLDARGTDSSVHTTICSSSGRPSGYPS